MKTEYKKAWSNTPATLRQLLDPQKTTSIVMKFITITSVCRHLQEEEMEKEVAQRDETWSMEGKGERGKGLKGTTRKTRRRDRRETQIRGEMKEKKKQRESKAAPGREEREHQ